MPGTRARSTTSHIPHGGIRGIGICALRAILRSGLRTGVWASLGITISACSLLKASPGPDAGFLPEPEKLTKLEERAPFHAGFVADPKKLDELKQQYDTVVIEPIVLDFALEKIKKLGLSPSTLENRIEDAQGLAQYFEQRMLLKFANNETKNWKVSREPVPNSFVWQIAITDIQPTNPAISVAATAAGYFVPGGGLIRLAGIGSITIECVIRDGNTGEVLAAFRDRESDKSAAFSVRDYQMYGYIRAAMDDWADQFTELAGTNEDHKVEDSSAVTLNPF